MPSLPTSSSGPSQPKNARKYLRKGLKAIMRSHHVHIPKYDMPIRLRPVRRLHPDIRCVKWNETDFEFRILVVRGLYMCHYDFAGHARLHQFLKIITTER